MAAAKGKEKAELVECVASARRKARFARSAKTVAASTRAREMVAAELKRAPAQEQHRSIPPTPEVIPGRSIARPVSPGFTCTEDLPCLISPTWNAQNYRSGT